MKKIKKAVLTATACLGFLGLFAEAQTIGAQILITAASAAILWLSAKALERMGALD